VSRGWPPDDRIGRRTFLKAAALAGAAATAPGCRTPPAAAGETLYNGIVLPAEWPPRDALSDRRQVPAYLSSPPDVIPIDVGRQLFVDDFLIDETTLTRTFHHPVYHPASPVLSPETPWEVEGPSPCASVFSDGVFHDPADGVFKMWYMGGYRRNTCLAVSEDGVRWRRPALDVWQNSNIVLGGGRDSTTVWLDHHAAHTAERFKMSIFQSETATLHTSPDGIHWKRVGETGTAGDRTTFFYNPFRRVWVFGIRANTRPNGGRYREYWEHARFEAANQWNGVTPVRWVSADSLDLPRREMVSEAELYNLDAVAYESVLLGLFTIWRGEAPTREKVNEITFGFSRDGFHWHRPDRRSAIAVSETPGAWNHANIQSAGGCCLVVGDQLYFYMSARTGVPGDDEPGTCTTGLAVMRRDGFASLDWSPETRGGLRSLFGQPADAGLLVTRPLRFTGDHLFVNASLDDGTLEADVVDESGAVVPGLSRAECVAVRGDGTRLPVRWRSRTLSAVAGRPVRLRLWLTGGRVYAFWITPHASGASRGYCAAGGPGLGGPVDSPSGY
jgi:hypothetical protein